MTRHTRAWTFQDSKEVVRLGKKKASWGVGWREPDGTRRQRMCGPGDDGRKAAFRLAKKIEAQLMTGSYISDVSTGWQEFRAEYDKTILQELGAENRRITETALAHFERIVKPTAVENIGLKAIDKYIAERKNERGKKPGSRVSPATINKELRHLKAVFAYAEDWGALTTGLKFTKRWQREPEKEPRYTPPEHFAAIYAACDIATLPVISSIPPGAWWRARCLTSYLHGWRVGELGKLKRRNTDLEAGTIKTTARDNKGKRDDRIRLLPVVVDHLRLIQGFGEFVFEWPHPYAALWEEFRRIQEAAGIHLDCDGDHEHTPACHVYGFHDLRRAFATENEENFSPLELQQLMRHRSFTTTQGYINMAKKRQGSSAEKLHVPDFLKQKKPG